MYTVSMKYEGNQMTRTTITTTTTTTTTTTNNNNNRRWMYRWINECIDNGGMDE